VQQADVSDLPFSAHSFDVITSIDVLYHQAVRDDSAPLREFCRVLRPGGFLILRVPAHPWLSSRHDALVHTRSRYTKNEVIQKLKATGFQVETVSYWGLSLLPILSMNRALQRFFPGTGAEFSKLPKTLNGFFHCCLRFESFLSRFFILPSGVGVLAVATKSPA